MGGEFGQEREWNHDHSLDWHLLADASHRGVQSLIRDLNRLYRGTPALHKLDCEQAGFEWIDGGNADQSILSYLRFGGPEDAPVLAVCNFTPMVRHGFRIGVPKGGRWIERLNTDAAAYGGSNVGNLGGLQCAGDIRARPAVLDRAHTASPRDTRSRARRRIEVLHEPRRLRRGGWPPLPSRCDLRRTRRQFRRLLGERRGDRGLPVRQRRHSRDGAHQAAGIYRRGLSRLCARRRSGPALRHSRVRTLRARGRAPLQSEQAVARPLRQRAARQDYLA